MAGSKVTVTTEVKWEEGPMPFLVSFPAYTRKEYIPTLICTPPPPNVERASAVSSSLEG